MSHLALIAGVPEVRSAVLGDLTGGFLDAVREPDGETVAAVAGFLATALIEAGEHLGLGALQRAAVGGSARAHAIAIQGGAVIIACVEPPASLPAVERVLDAGLQGRG